MSDPERARRLSAARRARHRRRRKEQAAADRRTAAYLAAWLEANCPDQAAWLIGHAPPEVAGAVVDELLRRDQARAGGGGG